MAQLVDDEAVPVAVDVAGSVSSQVLRVVEGALGWPVVAVDDRVLPPRCVLVDPPRAAAHAGGSVPVALVTTPDDDPAQAARAGRHAAVVLDGVPDAATLLRAVGEVAATAPTGRAPWCVVVAAAGGVGATTVATALGGLRAWRTGPTLVAVSGHAHQDGAPDVDAGDLASPAVWTAAAEAVGLRGCRVVRLRRPGVPPDVGAVPVVLDIGVQTATPGDVLVARPDAAGVAARAEQPAAALVLVGRGPVPVTAFRGDGAGPVVPLPWSARVAGAAARGRLPADLPGTWLRPLVPLVEALEQRAGPA